MLWCLVPWPFEAPRTPPTMGSPFMINPGDSCYAEWLRTYSSFDLYRSKLCCREIAAQIQGDTACPAPTGSIPYSHEICAIPFCRHHICGDCAIRVPRVRRSGPGGICVTDNAIGVCQCHLWTPLSDGLRYRGIMWGLNLSPPPRLVTTEVRIEWPVPLTNDGKWLRPRNARRRAMY